MKVLIISHNPISTYQNMGKTLLSLFSGFDREELCQLYIYPTHPDIDFCSSYYRVTDKEVLKSYYRPGVPGGVVSKDSIHGGQPMYEKASDESLYRNPKNKSHLRRMARDLMWKCSRWYNKKLKAWLDEQKPTCIFVAPGIAKFTYDIALKISREYKIPIVTYVCDEYCLIPMPGTLIGNFQHRLFRRKFKELMENTAHCISISEELKQLYQTNFNVESTVIMTGSMRQIAEAPRESREINKLSYFGNVRCNRYFSLCDIGEVLDAINKAKGTDYKLEIYSVEKNKDILNHFSGYESIEFKGFLTGEAYTEALESADMLVHVEGFDEESIEKVKYSVSTKIADSLAIGIPFMAYAPRGISSLEHLVRNECALFSCNKEELRATLEKVFDDGSLCVEYIDKALSVAQNCHNADNNSMKLYKIIGRVQNEK